MLGLGVAPPVGLWAYADSSAVTARRGEVPASVASAPLPHVVTPLLSARRLPGVVAGADPARDLLAKLAAIPVADTSCLAVAVDGAPVFSVRPDLPVVPASNMKLLIGAAALELLTPTFTFTTSAASLTPPDGDGAIAGDLYLVGGGDPLLSTEPFRSRTIDPAHQGEPYTELEQLADDLVRNGVRSITGAVVGTEARYDNEYVQATWPKGLDPTSRPGAISALRIDGGVDSKGQPFADPPTAAAARLGDLLQARGVTIAGKAHAGVLPGGESALGSVTSAPLSAIVASMLRVSDNGTAEMLTKELAVGPPGGVGTTAAGLEIAKARLVDWKIPDAGVSLVDGSGLGSDNKLTCQVLLGIVDRYHVGDPLVAGLPVAGTRGTLTNLFKGSPVVGQLMAKTGSLGNVRALTGLLPRDGHLVEFSYVLNEPGIGATETAAEPRWRALADAMLAFPYRPDLGAYEPAAAVAG